ncbi:MAG: nitroreductase [Caldilineaceae bacterium]|nr:nitroreductase [Caldilineaceae bacterium]
MSELDARKHGAQFAAVASAIRERRTIKEFTAQPVPRDLIAALLDLAVWAPNHKMTEPWRFYVFEGAATGQLADLARNLRYKKLLATGAEESIAARKAAEFAEQWAQVPAVIYVTLVGDPDPGVDLENYGAVCCAVQNIMLGAQAAGLASFWGTGDLAAARALADLVGAGENERMVALIRLGYAEPGVKAPVKRTGAGQLTRWVE